MSQESFGEVCVMEFSRIRKLKSLSLRVKIAP